MKHDDICLLNSRLEVTDKVTAVEALETFLDEFDRLKSFRKKQIIDISAIRKVFTLLSTYAYHYIH